MSAPRRPVGRLNLLAVAVAATLLAFAVGLVPGVERWLGVEADTAGMARYGAALLVFALWMIWFVSTAAQLWRWHERR